MSELESLRLEDPKEKYSPAEKQQIDYLNRSICLRICSALGNKAAQRLDRIKVTIGAPIREVLDIIQSSSHVSDEWKEYINLDELRRSVYEHCIKDPQNTVQLRQVAERDPVNAAMNIYNYMHGMPMIEQPRTREPRRKERGFEIPKPLPTIESEQNKAKASQAAQCVEAKAEADHHAKIQRIKDETRQITAMQEQQQYAEYKSIMASVNTSDVDEIIEKDIRDLEAECEQLGKLDSQNEETQNRLRRFLAKLTTTRINDLLMLLQLHPKLSENLHGVHEDLERRYENKLSALREKYQISSNIQEIWQSQGRESKYELTDDQESSIKVYFSSISGIADIYIEVRESLGGKQQPNEFLYSVTANNSDNIECGIDHDDSTKRYNVTKICIKNLMAADVPSLSINLEDNSRESA